ncbi:MAG: hypothetical protein JOY62_01265 [Acidobacteriaceae bacterium]|nr:hypothetical protein [Acidobacteriaceae bacterium]MBV9778575.1 hypothetical protein [Acidobacteriaceae bacterium]
MQQLLKWMRQLVYPAAAIFLIWAGYQVVASPFISETNGKVVVVYDGDSTAPECTDVAPNAENVSEAALAGLCQAVHDQQGHGPDVHLVNIHEELQDSAGRVAKIYERLGSEIAHGSVLGVISLLTSPDSPPVVRFCRTMQIPLLLAVAANDDLMSSGEDAAGIVFRLMPTNGRQAAQIAIWLRSRMPLRLALFHEPNSFGEFLRSELTRELEPEIRSKRIIIYNFEVTEQLQFADLMPELWCSKLDAVAYLGFAPGAMDLLSKLKWYRADKDQVACEARDASQSFKNLTVLLASGAYEQDLDDTDKYTFPFPVFAMLPTRPGGAGSHFSSSKTLPTENDASEYGYDSYMLMRRLAAQNPESEARTDLRRILSQSTEESKTGHEYRFDRNGELQPAEKNRYQAYALASARKP